MKENHRRVFLPLLLSFVILGLLTGCTSKADKEAAQQATEQAAQQATLASMPTNTPIPPTNTPIPTATPTPTEIPTPTNTPLPSIDDLVIDEKGFGQTGETVAYVFVAINPDEYNAVTDAVYRVFLYDASNAPIQTTTITIPLHLPGQYLGIAGEDVVEPGVEITQIDVEPLAGNFTTLDPSQPIPLFQIDSVGFTDKTLTTAIGIIKNAYPADVPNVLVSALAYNQQGVLVGGGSTIVETIPANEQQYVEIPLITSEPPNGGITLYPTLSDTAFIVPNAPATKPLTITNDPLVTPQQPITATTTTTMTDTDDMQREAETPTVLITTTATKTTNDGEDANERESLDKPTDEGQTPTADETAGATVTATVETVGEADRAKSPTPMPTSDTPTPTSDTPTAANETTATVAEETTTLTPMTTTTVTPTLTPTPTVPRPTGRCQDNAPSTPPNGPLAWLPRSSLKTDEEGVVCVWFVLDNQPIEGAEVKMNLLYLDKNVPQVVNGNIDTTDDLGLAELSFRVPNTYELELELIVKHNGVTYDWHNYPDELGLMLYTE